MKSRRKGFRFGNFEIPVTFKTAYSDGNGLLVNISTGGCGLKNVCPDLETGDTFLLAIALNNITAPIEARGIVLRVEAEYIAAQFVVISDGSRNQIRTCFAEILRTQQHCSL
jgi:hypothetical protein